MPKRGGHNFIDLSGKVFGRLTVIERAPRPAHISNTIRCAYFRCRCVCGNERIVVSASLLSGNSKSCGCFHKEINKLSKNKAKKHGMSHSPEFKSWIAMIERCYTPSNTGFKRYGGRGIKVCEEWRNDFLAFYRDMGKKPGPEYSIDRINNATGHYCKENCRWATRDIQYNNRMQNRPITYHGKTMNLGEWAKHLGMNKVTLLSRLDNGWEIERAFTQPVRKHRKWESIISIDVGRMEVDGQEPSAPDL